MTFMYLFTVGLLVTVGLAFEHCYWMVVIAVAILLTSVYWAIKCLNKEIDNLRDQVSDFQKDK